MIRRWLRARALTAARALGGRDKRVPCHFHRVCGNTLPPGTAPVYRDCRTVFGTYLRPITPRTQETLAAATESRNL
ncbi:hypothetical protein [Nocardia asiatica]|uniref:hypothetical protein n=1 Tax=Nocardia asiatica TaxID=209252 RepID=UPI0002FAFF44|nr:hypothetical protein [Nocardia asiatica]